MRILSLFSGYGGLDAAAEHVFGATTAYVSDIDKGARKVLAHRYPDAPNLGDITTIDWSQVEPVDIITGGSPCQDLSTAGRRAGMTDGTRSNLWVAMREAIANVQPTYVIWENVRGAFSACASSDADRDLGFCPRCLDPRDRTARHDPNLRALGRVLGDLSDLGFDAEWRGLRASDVGACHQRFRVFVLAWRRDAVPAHPAGVGGREGVVDSELHGATSGWSPALSHEPTGGTAGDLTLLPSPVAQPSGNSPEVHLRKKPGRTVVTDLAVLVENGLLETGGRLLPTPVADNSRGLPSEGTDFQSLPNEVTHRFGQYAAAIARHELMIGRAAPSPVEPGRSGKPRLSAAFVEWMMGLPADWIVGVPGVTRNEALKLGGNGVVPHQAAAALADMLAAMRQGVAA